MGNEVSYVSFPARGGRNQSPRGSRETEDRERETLPEGGTGASGEKEGQTRDSPNAFIEKKMNLIAFWEKQTRYSGGGLTNICVHLSSVWKKS